ncbi:PREDICTED: uncharacterized protein LOC109472572 [Branchiostoma belcheri]|uniref:receptor protein-tyrosine kinase n=1 Tax=Branchiostoma belcheri TaxID=7741 RepID=A0A6P4ZE43_BRABE|nr:PREDICTED: uncharacterized protein LOC109472572 [Branchiostoma belcheri]
MAACVPFCTVLLLTSLLPASQAHRNLVVLSENVTIREDASVGSTVKRLTDVVDSVSFEEDSGTFWTVNITQGDAFGRFGVDVETLTLTVAAPLDYELTPLYNLSLELTNTRESSFWHVNLLVLVMDVPGYPPCYNKRCETPILPGHDTTENYMVMSSNGYFHIIYNGDTRPYPDFLPYWRYEAVNAAMHEDCSLRLCVALTKLSPDAQVFLPALDQRHQGRIEFKCHDRQLQSKGNLVVVDIALNNTLPAWATQNDQCNMTEGFRYVSLLELNDIWSSSSYLVQCGTNVTLEAVSGLTMPFKLESVHEFNITGCPVGKYGLYCDKDCVCKSGARCHGFNGACECRPGWRGRACDIPWPEVAIIATPGDLDVKYIGTNLTLTCLAPHIDVGKITWLYQATNKGPNTKIIEEKAVQNSSINFQLSESDNGEYTCETKATGGGVFNATFVINATECPPNRYGEFCRQVCDCEYGGTCDRWEGCLCPPGRHGDRCEGICAPGTFGLNCSGNCYCQNNTPCDPVNGTCICAEGQFGEFCQNDLKPEGNQDVVKLLATVLPSMVVVGCIVVSILVKLYSNHAEYTTVDLEMETLSPWELEKEDISFEHMIGEGEFGHVVRARLRVLELGYEVLVAAKCIRPDRMTGSAVRDFRREMDILARIHEDKEGHPNVVKFYGVVTKSDPQYIIVEYASNEELRRYLWSLREQCKITGDRKLLERLGFASDVACGLSELARLKIVHRDIAARNVVISDRKVAKIADFGLSRDVYVSSAYKRTEQGGEEELLPLKWMAVESLRDGVYTCESDVWSYGVLLWEITSFGEDPRYAGGPMHPDVCTLLELLKKGVRLQQPENCPLPVYRIIRSCWIVDPSKRPKPEELLRKIDLLRPTRHAAYWS